MIEFKDEDIQKLDLQNSRDFINLFCEYLCSDPRGGRKCVYISGDNDTKHCIREEEVVKIISQVCTSGINYEQFNEILLLMNKTLVERPFFEIFFGEGYVKLYDIMKGVERFRGFAMLCFGNFRNAFKTLSKKSTNSDLNLSLLNYDQNSKKLIGEYRSRPTQVLNINHIDKSKTWYIGYIASRTIERELNLLNSYYSQTKDSQIIDYLENIKDMQLDMKKTMEQAKINTDIYLTWDYMDVYIATSMRNIWEFEDTYDFVNELFKQQDLKNLNLRWFDPTQSLCINTLDKGLLEGLMLKRSSCTIFMVQETDTMGKDSELAGTLAQGKPVIAYVPRIDINKYSKKIESYPLEYFLKRFFLLRGEEIYYYKDCEQKLKEQDKEYEIKLDKFLQLVSKYRKKQPFTLWKEKDSEFKEINSNLFYSVCRILSICEYYNFEKRAETLKSFHPLSIQVQLDTGIAYGILVVRTVDDCAKLLYRILTNELTFTIKRREEGKGMFTLIEEISGCAYRVITQNERLTSSFWNFYLAKK